MNRRGEFSSHEPSLTWESAYQQTRTLKYNSPRASQCNGPVNELFDFDDRPRIDGQGFLFGCPVELLSVKDPAPDAVSFAMSP